MRLQTARAYLVGVMLAILTVSAAMASSHPHGPFGNVLLLKAHGALVIEVADISIQANSIPDVLNDRASLDKEFKKAVGEARGHAALLAALKNYYAALRAFLTGLQPQANEAVIVYHARVSSLETQAKSAGERLDVELQALGVNTD